MREITSNSCAFSHDQTAGTASFDFTLVFCGELVDVVAVLNVLSMEVADTYSGIAFTNLVSQLPSGWRFESGQAYLLSDPPA
ncbi:hypothetical protein KUL25_00495 [Rhodobacteraceae bacterium N5(2021)]|uniref:Uncharacterized protein n=1 Tax=Gymnodinialimonas phycosphaerae TaxID=2841589 RepID=A0A975TUS1_9RHOB|nr:hypothetical protein [Gymnodinialimonas phycosphaerae]MBY4891238.1 hypothetical protein [Gymnodinialimonas phycosphaerae]